MLRLLCKFLIIIIVNYGLWLLNHPTPPHPSCLLVWLKEPDSWLAAKGFSGKPSLPAPLLSSSNHSAITCITDFPVNEPVALMLACFRIIYKLLGDLIWGPLQVWY